MKYKLTIICSLFSSLAIAQQVDVSSKKINPSNIAQLLERLTQGEYELRKLDLNLVDEISAGKEPYGDIIRENENAFTEWSKLRMLMKALVERMILFDDIDYLLKLKEQFDAKVDEYKKYDLQKQSFEKGLSDTMITAFSKYSYKISQGINIRSKLAGVDIDTFDKDWSFYMSLHRKHFSVKARL